MSRFASSKAFLMTSAAIAAAAAAGSAWAQDDDANSVDAVVVTASRAAVTGYSASTPTTVIGQETFQKQGLTNVGQVIAQNPAFKATLSPNGNGVKSAAPGQAAADLRGLGGQRTLVLVNGSRVVPLAPSTNTGVPVTTDLNTIPSMLIQRAEVVTGGASAQWGSDAIAGVVNIILNNNFTGLKIQSQYGISDRSDAERRQLGAIAGTDFAGGKGHVVVAAEWEKNDGLDDYRSRDWARQKWNTVSNSAANVAAGGPNWLTVPNVNSALAEGGLITGPANFSLRGYAFNPDGSVRRYDTGSLTSGLTQIGGEGIASWAGVNLVPSVKRLSTYARGQYELTDSITASLEVGYSELRGQQNGTLPRLSSITIRRDNAYLPTQVGAAMDAAGLTSFTMNRMNTDVGNSHNTIRTKTPHAALGLEGKFNDKWSWDAHYTVGENKYKQVITNSSVTPRYTFAEDAVVNPANGQIVCRATLQGNPAAAGCVPINLFGSGNVSAAARDYVSQTAVARSKYWQQTAAFNVKGDLVDLPAGPLSIGAGVEWRHEKQKVDANDLANQGAFLSLGNASDFQGKFSTKEAYIDSIIPIVKDLPWAKSIDLNASGRIADYTSVGTQKTWKVGLNYEPVDGLRFRVTESRDIRAPAIYELFGGGQVVTTSISVKGMSLVIPQNFTGGNPNLDAEKSKTFTAGVVLEPHFFPGMRASVDYFDIKIHGAVTNLGSQTVANLCNQGSALFCGLFTYDSAGVPISLNAPAQNLSEIEVKGIDFALNYTKDLSGFAGMPDGSNLALGVQGTWTGHSWVDTSDIGGLRVDRAGENTEQNAGAVPTWRITYNQSLTVGKATVTAQEFYVSKGNIDNLFNSPQTTTTININKIPKVIYVSLFGNYRFNDHLTAFGAVDNLFDKAPPVSPYPGFPIPGVSGTFYDKIGRAYRVGLTYTF